MRRLSLARAAAFAAAALLMGASAQADDLDAIRAAKTLRIGTEGTYAPFSVHDASGALVGFDVEIGRKVAEKLGVAPQFVEGKWDGLIAGLDAKRYDVVINQVSITKERQAKFDFSEPYIRSRAVVITRADNGTIKSFADLKGKKSAQSLSSNFARLATEAGAEPVGTDGFDQSIQLVVTGRADATVNDNVSFLDFHKKQPNAPVKVVAQKDDADASGILLRKNNPALKAALDKALAEIKADGSYAAIAQTYFGADVSQ